jgi:hypothetical protein
LILVGGGGVFVSRLIISAKHGRQAWPRTDLTLSRPSSSSLTPGETTFINPLSFSHPDVVFCGFERRFLSGWFVMIGTRAGFVFGFFSEVLVISVQFFGF